MILKKYKSQINLKGTDILFFNKISVQLKKNLILLKFLQTQTTQKFQF